MRTYRAIVEAFDPGMAEPNTDVLSGPEDAAMASCVRHRVLDALPYWTGCVFCTAGI
ncbi:hypothetical protein [Streptomyces globisporus]